MVNRIGHAVGSISCGFALDGDRATDEAAPIHHHRVAERRAKTEPWCRNDMVDPQLRRGAGTTERRMSRSGNETPTAATA